MARCLLAVMGRLFATSDALGWRVTVGEDAGMSHWAAGRKAPAALNLHIYHAFRAGAGISAQIVITAGTARWPPPSLSVANLVQIGIGSPARIGRVPATS